jgi:hypothetical protein
MCHAESRARYAFGIPLRLENQSTPSPSQNSRLRTATEMTNDHKQAKKTARDPFRIAGGSYLLQLPMLGY